MKNVDPRTQTEKDESELDLKAARLNKRKVLEIQEIKNNPISVFLIKKYTKDEKLDTKELLRSLYRFVNTKNVTDKLRFIFELYDLDNDGLISSKDLFEILKILNKGILEDWKLQNIVDKTFAKGGEYRIVMNQDEFIKLVSSNTKSLEEMFGT